MVSNYVDSYNEGRQIEVWGETAPLTNLNVEEA